MQLNVIHSTPSHRKSKRVGRGQGSGRGKTSGRGGKGQTARAGAKLRPEIRDIIKKLPKRRGYGKNRARAVNPERAVPVEVTIDRLEIFAAGESVTPATLVAKGVIRMSGGKTPMVKLIGNSGLTKKLAVSGCSATAGARAAIEKAGGSIAALSQ